MTRNSTLTLLFLYCSLCFPASAIAASAATTTPELSPANSASAGPLQVARAEAAKESGPCAITVGWDPWEPYQYRDDRGRLEGLDVDLLRLVARNAGCELDFVEGNWADLLVQLNEGKVDLLTGASRTEPRERYAHFTEPYRAESFALYVRNNRFDERGADDLETLLKQGFKIGVTADYVYGDELTRLQQTPAYADLFVPADVGETNFTRLYEDEIDGLLEDPFVASAVIRRRNLGHLIERYGARIHSGDVHFMLSKKSVPEATLQKLNASLDEVRADGRHAGVISSYLEE